MLLYLWIISHSAYIFSPLSFHSYISVTSFGWSQKKCIRTVLMKKRCRYSNFHADFSTILLCARNHCIKVGEKKLETGEKAFIHIFYEQSIALYHWRRWLFLFEANILVCSITLFRWLIINFFEGHMMKAFWESMQKVEDDDNDYIRIRVLITLSGPQKD